MPVSTVGDIDIVWEARGAGEPVILISGIGAPRAAWDLQVPALAEHFRVITFDNRDVGETGYGRSPRLFILRLLANDVLGLMNNLGIERAHIVGASMGGAIAQELAINVRSRVHTLTLVGSWAKADRALVELFNQWEQIFEELGQTAWQRATLPWCYTHRWFADQERFYDADALTLKSWTHSFQDSSMYVRQSFALKSHDTLGRLQRINAPTHVICGAEDILTPLRFSQQLAEHIPGSRLTVLPNAGHGLFWETPAAFNQALLEFLRQHSDGAPQP